MLNVVTGTDPEDPTTAPADAERARRLAHDARSRTRCKGKRIGYIPSTWEDPFGTTGTIEATKAALKYLTDAGATIVEMGTTVGDANTPPAPAVNPTGNTSQEGWMQYIDAHPELAEQGFQIRNAVDVSCSPEEGRVRAPGPERRAPSRPRARMTADELTARRNYRLQYKANAEDVAGHGGRGQPRRRRRRLPGPAERHQRSTTAVAASRASAAATRRAPARASRPSSSRRASTTTASRSTCSCSAARGTTTSSSAWPTRSSSSRTRTARATSRRPPRRR